jgi:hypothetical protein
MATSQQFLVCDSSTLPNFKSWAQAISTAFSTFGWLQSSDTGQVNWGTISAVPSSAAFVYEIWQPNDGLTNFYAKVEYGNFYGTNSPCIRVTLGTGTNGAGTLTGFVTSAFPVANVALTPPSTSTTYECDFTGGAGRMGVMMWRVGGNNSTQVFAIERSVDSSGAYTSGSITLYVCGPPAFNDATNPSAAQQTILLGVGVGPTVNRTTARSGMNVATRILNWWGLSSSAFNGFIPFDTLSPAIGYFDQPLTQIGFAFATDMAEGVPFTTTLYGATRTYIPTKGGYTTWCAMSNNGNPNPMALCFRYD